MKYNGIELTPITTPQIFDPPKEMVVWDSACGTPQIEPVCAITIRKTFPVITVESCYDYCAEIPKQPNKRGDELKVQKIGELCFDFKMGKNIEPFYYRKSEVDAVISELKAENEALKKEL